MLRSPRTTLSGAISAPRSLDLGALVVVIATLCSVGFLLTGVGRLAALDQQVRQFESLGTVVTDQVYAQMRHWQPYRPLLSAFGIIVGWPAGWLGLAWIIHAAGSRRAQESAIHPKFAQVLTVVVHASS